MALSFSEDLTAFFDTPGFTETVVHSSATGVGYLDQPDEVIADGLVLTTDYRVTVIASVFSSVSRGDTLTVAGVDYTVRETMLIDDGKVMRIMLTKD